MGRATVGGTERERRSESQPGRVVWAALLCGANACTASTGRARPDASAEGSTPRDASSAGLPKIAEAAAPRADAGMRGARSGSSTDAGRDGIFRIEGAGWKLVEAGEVPGSACHLYAAENLAAFPALEWSSCGPSCESVDPTQGLGAYVVSESAGTRDGVAYASFGHPLGTKPGHDYAVRLVRLKDGATESALGVAYGGSVCLDSYFSSPFIHWHRAGTTSEEHMLYGVSPSPSKDWVWAAPAPRPDAIPQDRMAVGIGTRIVSLGFGAVHLLSPPDPTWTTIEDPSSALYGVGTRDLALWVESDSPRLRAWAPDGRGPRTELPKLPDTTCAFGANPTTIAGLATDGCLGPSTSFTWWTLPVGGSPEELRIGPKITTSIYVGSPDDVKIDGNHAAALIYDGDPQSGSGVPFFVVLELTTLASYRVPVPPPRQAEDTLWTIDDTYLYWGEIEDPLQGRNVVRLVRVPLAALDRVGAPLGP